MCLTSRTKTPAIAIYDIVVYKVLMRVNNTDGCKYFAPYVISPFNAGVVYEYKKGVNLPEGNKDVIEFLDMNPPIFLLKSGFLHAYCEKEKAERIAYAFNGDRYQDDDNEYIVAEMKIPSGSEVYYGDKVDICSNCLVWEE